MKKSLVTYERILSRAWKTTRTHWELWIVGMFAGLAYSGTVLQHVLQQLLRLRPADSITISSINESVPGVPYILEYGRALIAMPSDRLAITLAAIGVIIAAFILVTVIAQHILLTSLHRASKRKKHISAGKLLHEADHVHFLRMFAIDALIILCSTLLVAGSSIPLSLLLREHFISDIFIYFAFYLLLLPLLFAINLVGMFTLIHVVRLDDGIDRAFMRAIETIKKHWLVAAEQACIILGINIFALLAFIVFVVLLLLLVAAPVFLIATVLGSVTLMSLTGFVSFIIVSIGYILFFGMVTTLNYAIWTELAEHLERFTLTPALEGFMRKLKR